MVTDKIMAVAGGVGADQAATRRCRLSELLPEAPPINVCRLRTSQPALRSAVVLILLLGILPSGSKHTPRAIIDRSAPTALGIPCTGSRCLRLQGGLGARVLDGTADVPGQVRPPSLPAPPFPCPVRMID